MEDNETDNTKTNEEKEFVEDECDKCHGQGIDDGYQCCECDGYGYHRF